jgi:hypothetical protein
MRLRVEDTPVSDVDNFSALFMFLAPILVDVNKTMNGGRMEYSVSYKMINTSDL